MGSLPSQLVFDSHGEPFARLCIDATFYWRGSMFTQAPQIANAYRRALDAMKGHIKFFETGSMAGAKKLNADSLEMIPFWLLKAKRRDDIYMLNLKGGETLTEPSDIGIQFIADEEEDPPMGAMSLSVPSAYVDRPDELLELVEDILRSADFESGHCGYSVSWDSRSDSATDAQQRMQIISGRFLGIDLPKLNTTISAMRRSKVARIKTVQWLTFLGASLVEQLGGAKLATELLEGIGVVRDIGRGLLIQAGATPTLGDTNRRMDVSALKKVGKALKSVRLENHGPIFGTREQTNAWLSRLDD